MRENAYTAAIERIHAPADVVEKALLYSKSAEAKPAFDTVIKPAFRISARYLAAASVVLVVALSVSCYFFFRNIDHSQIPVLSSTQSASFDPADGSEKPSEKSSAPVISSEKPSQLSTQLPTDVKNHSAAIPATEPTEDSAPFSPEEPSGGGQQPTAAPKPEPTQAVIEPTEHIVPTEDNTEPGPVEPSAGECFAYIPLDRLTGSLNVYCALYDRRGNLMGDSDYFSDAHLAVKEWERDGCVWVSYCPSKHYHCPSDVYQIYFYNEDSEILSYKEEYI